MCSNCGLPFEQRVNYSGVPIAVGRQGDPAGFWIRFVAAIIDGIIVLVASIPLIVISATGSGGVSALADLLQFFFGVLYAPVLLSLYGTTGGKKLFNIYVLDANGNRKLNFFRALLRELAKYVSAIILLIGYIMAAFRQDKRALHDLIAGTYPTTV